MRNIINAWGSTLMGIQFPGVVDVSGAFFAAQGTGSGITSGVRVHGYLGGIEVSTTGWFANIDETPDWFAMNAFGVDRIVVESVPTSNGGGWYGMDDLTFEVVPEPATMTILAIGGLLLRKRNA